MPVTDVDITNTTDSFYLGIRSMSIPNQKLSR